MLPELYCQVYQGLRRSVEQLKEAHDCYDSQGSTSQGASSWGSSIQEGFQVVQQSFQTVLNLGLDELDSDQVAMAQSYYTEMNRQMRLLATDMVFLQAARQKASLGQRHQQIGDRIAVLLQYCNALLELGSG